jgi:hypothetical protein
MRQALARPRKTGDVMGIAILYPVLAQIILTLAVAFGMGLHRGRALTSHEVEVEDIALDSSRWPARSRQFANNYGNQFELPVLFYVLCIVAQITNSVDLIFLILAWIFVISRVVHAFEHTTSNVVRRRGAIFFIGYICLCIMTAMLVFRFLIAPIG